MLKRIHPIAGTVAFLFVLMFWTSTVTSELLGTAETVARVKTMIRNGLVVLLPAMMVVGASGMNLGRRRKDQLTRTKSRRMPLIAANGILILVPSAFFLQAKAAAAVYDTSFYAVQVIELVAGAINLYLMGRSIRDGRAMRNRRKHFESGSQLGARMS